MDASVPLSESSIPRPEKEYLAFLAQGRFMIQRSRSSGRCVFYPRIAEPGTGATDLEWIAASGNATVYAATVNHPKPPTPDYSVVLVDLEEGPRMMSRVEGLAPSEVKIGLKVKARIVKEGEGHIVVFHPA
ncbi:Zn-ribbon domain-containing OB-fold protein [Hydrogenophaga sp. BPS33]|uniref:Zn-ribbon domain-containing OB-fold protein n=1 Tax=Hydrogenophaga sp. BPS33 TaxID=2651974 RepID=UPI00131F95D3|nr:OB-fold domain-containing protein [Hydrogenophaga sp. BPS33]QHE84792.1 hypothetical protein F9K07_07810 [Hydrogenophaga sp. BPS33]